MPKTVFWLRAAQLTTGAAFSASLFAGGFALLAKGGAGSAGLVVMFAGVIVFVVPIISKANVKRDRMSVVHVRTSARGRLECIGRPHFFCNTVITTTLSGIRER